MTTPKTYGAFKEYLDYLAYCDDADIRDSIENGRVTITRYSGVGGSLVREITTNYDATKSEKIIRGPTNSFIILGKDRVAGRESGYGGIGATGCAAIDIVAGHLGTRPIEKIKGANVKTNKDFKNDASRIYLSQMCDIDEYFNIPKFQTSLNGKLIDLEVCKATSGIGIKSDNVRIIAREAIKLVTFHSTTNSLGDESAKCGIDIIAGANIAQFNKDPFLEPQPMVKGANLVECLAEILGKIDELSEILSAFMDYQLGLNEDFADHRHITGKPGSVTDTMTGVNTSMKNFIQTIENIATYTSKVIGTQLTKEKYFNALSPKYINSTFNRVN